MLQDFLQLEDPHRDNLNGQKLPHFQRSWPFAKEYLNSYWILCSANQTSQLINPRLVFKDKCMNNLCVLTCKHNFTLSSLPRMAKHRFQSYGFTADRSFKMKIINCSIHSASRKEFSKGFKGAEIIFILKIHSVHFLGCENRRGGNFFHHLFLCFSKLRMCRPCPALIWPTQISCLLLKPGN